MLMMMISVVSNSVEPARIALQFFLQSSIRKLRHWRTHATVIAPFPPRSRPVPFTAALHGKLILNFNPPSLSRCREARID